MSNLTDLGLVPANQHPDAELFHMIAQHKARHEAWNAARGEEAKRQLLRQWHDGGPLRQEAEIAKFVPATLEGLFEKADAALRSWRDDQGEDRYKRIWAIMATALEQAIDVLQAQQSLVMPARHGDEQ